MQYICDFHLRFIKSVCCENLCQQKLLCDECIRMNNDHAGHRLVEINQFRNLAEQFIKGGYPDVVLYGADSATKSKQYLEFSYSIKQEMHNVYMKKLEEQIEKYNNQLINGLKASKKSLLDFINNIIEESFSKGILLNRESSITVVKNVANSMDQRVSTKEINNLIWRLHTGQLEKEYYERKIQGLIEFFQINLKLMLEPMSNQVNEYMKNFQSQIEKIKIQLKEEHFNINRINMIVKPFKIKEMIINPNLYPQIETSNQIDKRQCVSVSPQHDDQQPFIKLKTCRISKQRKLELLRSLDFTYHTSLSDHASQPNLTVNIQKGQIENSQDLKKIMTITSIHSMLLDVISIQGNTCISTGKEGLINIFQILTNENQISVTNCHQFKAHQEIKAIELCQTPGMFLTAGRNIKIINDKYIDQGYIVKLYLFQGIKEIELLTEFRDLHNQPIEKIKFINENYIRQRMEYSKFSNELEFATLSIDVIKVWKFSFDSSKIYEGEMMEQYKIDMKGQPIIGFDLLNDICLVALKQQYIWFNKSTELKQVSITKDWIIQVKKITNQRILLLTSQGILLVFDKQKQKNTINNSETLKIHLKKFLRPILFDKEEKELELIDCIQMNQSFVSYLHSQQFDHFVILNRNFDLDSRYRFTPIEIKMLRTVELEQFNLLLSIENKTEFSLWEMNKLSK